MKYIDGSRDHDFPECFARSSFERPLFEEDVLLQLARRIPGLYQDSRHPPDSLYFEPINEPNNYTLTNTAIGERLRRTEMVSRRFSIGISGLSGHHVTKSIFDLKDGFTNNKMQSMRDNTNEQWFSYQATDKLSSFETPHSPMKVSPCFFDEVGKAAVRRCSIDSDSMESFATESVCDDKEGGRENYFDEYILEDNVPFQFNNSNQSENVPGFVTFPNIECAQAQFQNLPFLSVTMLQSPEVKGAIDSFTNSMTKSMRSQQAIHDWDRKMGLKRSHSKTMRLSMRSRKRLKIMLKKELGIIVRSK